MGLSLEMRNNASVMEIVFKQFLLEIIDESEIPPKACSGSIFLGSLVVYYSL